MLTIKEIITILKKELPYLRAIFGVKRIGLFGSSAKGIQREDSDVDIVVEFEKPIGLKFIELSEHIENGYGFVREAAHRIFAIEFRDSNLQAKEGQDQYSPSYLLTPTGAFIVYAGQYQPEAAQVLAKTTPPEFIAVIGKPSTYTTKEGNVVTSIRPESVQIVDAATRDKWVVETAKHTMARLAKLQGTDQDAVRAREHYSTNVEQYREMVAMALESLRAHV